METSNATKENKVDLSEPQENKKKNLLFGVTGSVATIKLSVILDLLLESKRYNIKVMLSHRAVTFINFPEIKEKYSALDVEFYTDEDEWGLWKKKGDPVVHIDLRRWADILVIAPLSANTLAKIAGGLCDNLITCVVRAWDFSQKLNSEGKVTVMHLEGRETILLNKPIIVVPAMNTLMWNNPFTRKHLDVLRQLNIIDMDTISKELACKDVGLGAMAEPPAIVATIDKVSDLL